MKSKNTKVMSLIIVVMVLFTLISGCNGSTDKQTDTQDTSQTEKNNTNEDGIKPLEPITFELFINWTVDDWNGWGNDPVTQEFTRRTGVTLDITSATTADNAQINAMIASGDLPDFVAYGADSPLRPTLWKQGFLKPLNKLMDDYAPSLRNILAKDMDKIYQEEDGNFYMFVGFYADIDKIAKLPGTLNTVTGFSINKPMYEQVGSPEMKTLEQYRDIMKTIKKENPEIKYLAYDMVPKGPSDDRNMAQLINRAFGGTHINSIANDGTVHLNFRDESYKNAILYINSLYRDGLFDPENFTITKEEQYVDLLKNKKIFSVWGQPFNVFKWNDDVDGPYVTSEIPTNPGVQMTLNSVITGIGGGGVSITEQCKDPERAIKFFEFYLSDEGQMLAYHGIEGKDYEMVDGMPKNLPEKAKMWAEDFPGMQKEMGILNYNVCFATSMWVDMMYYYWMNEDAPAYKLDAEINNKYAINERINTLIKVPSDSDAKVTETKVIDLWTLSLPKMYLAESEAQCIDAYNQFVEQAEKLGLSELEAEYTKVYKEWLPKIQ